MPFVLVDRAPKARTGAEREGTSGTGGRSAGSADPLVSHEKGFATIERSESTMLWLRFRPGRALVAVDGSLRS